MPILPQRDRDTGILYTRLSGVVTDDDLIAYYERYLTHHKPDHPIMELVDGMALDPVEITGRGLDRLENLIVNSGVRLDQVRCAMVADKDVVFGMFRMWELRRLRISYPTRVFREITPAERWLLGLGSYTGSF